MKFNIDDKITTVVNPVMADAMRQQNKAEEEQEKVLKDANNAKAFPARDNKIKYTDAQKKMYLNESLFEGYDDTAFTFYLVKPDYTYEKKEFFNDREVDAYFAELDKLSDDELLEQGIIAYWFEDEDFELVDRYISSNADESKIFKLIRGESLNEDVRDGWDIDTQYSVLEEIEQAKYEIDNGYRGVYSKAKTYSELGEYLKELATRLNEYADDLMNKEETLSESLKEAFDPKDELENDIQRMTSKLWSKYSDISRKKVYELIANAHKDFPELDIWEGEFYYMLDDALASGKFEDYLDTGDKTYLK